MIELKRKTENCWFKNRRFRIYLGEDRNAPQNERVLLPSKTGAGGNQGAGDELEVFIYKDSGDRLIAM